MALLEHSVGQPPSVYTDADPQTAVVSAYCPKLPVPENDLRARLRTGLKQIRQCGLDTARARIIIRKVCREDWAESWKRHFRPLEIGGALLIAPSWSRRCPRAGQAVVVLDPGLSFGTGQHPTTAFCLEQIVARLYLFAGGLEPFGDLALGDGLAELRH